MANQSFSKQMRQATRDVHAVSDALVNAKLLFALSNNDVWAEGLLIFYEIFRALEVSMKQNKNSLLGQFLLDGLQRTEAFEKDLKHYLGDNWTAEYTVRDEVAEYLLYLRRLEEEDPDLLMAFVYHLYMGLLSGGQVLKRKRQIKDRILQRNGPIDGYAITNFEDVSIADLKKGIRDTMDSIADTLDESKKERLIEESRKVFEWNNKIIRTVKGTNRIVLEMTCFVVSIVVLLFIIFYCVF